MGVRGMRALGLGTWGHIDRPHSESGADDEVADSQRLVLLAIQHIVVVQKHWPH